MGVSVSDLLVVVVGCVVFALVFLEDCKLVAAVVGFAALGRWEASRRPPIKAAPVPTETIRTVPLKEAASVPSKAKEPAQISAQPAQPAQPAQSSRPDFDLPHLDTALPIIGESSLSASGPLDSAGSVQNSPNMARYVPPGRRGQASVGPVPRSLTELGLVAKDPVRRDKPRIFFVNLPLRNTTVAANISAFRKKYNIPGYEKDDQHITLSIIDCRSAEGVASLSRLLDTVAAQFIARGADRGVGVNVEGLCYIDHEAKVPLTEASHVSTGKQLLADIPKPTPELLEISRLVNHMPLKSIVDVRLKARQSLFHITFAGSKGFSRTLKSVLEAPIEERSFGCAVIDELWLSECGTCNEESGEYDVVHRVRLRA